MFYKPQKVFAATLGAWRTACGLRAGPCPGLLYNFSISNFRNVHFNILSQEASGKYVALTSERVEFLVDMMRDVNVYVESKDFELGLPITNFARYHELWSMQYGAEEEWEICRNFLRN